ncbi:hypothetical protein J6590_098485 [Homalodisca vitripennis]|nr:hypothetical protein J6590_098485 [Homalodisca vitripennis]
MSFTIETTKTKRSGGHRIFSARANSTGTLQPSPNLQRLSYADTVRGLPSDGLDGRSPVSKNLTVLTSAEQT